MICGKKLILKKRPSGLRILYNAFKTKKHKIKVGEKISSIQAEWQNLNLSRKHIIKFNKICRLDKTDSVNILYPFTLIYPINLWIISHREVPVPMFKMLTTRNTTLIHRDINVEDALIVRSKINGQRFLNNGMEFYMDSEIKTGDEILWENKSTLFIPGKINKESTLYKSFKLKEIPEAKILKEWFLPAGNGFRFARVMGDSNGIHYSKGYAKMLGFKRDFAQPVLVASKSIEYLPELPGDGPLKLDLFFKGPVYYNSELILKSVSGEKNSRFDLYCEGNERPCISGKLERI